MTTSVPFPIALGRFKQLPQRTTEIWQGGLVKLPAWIENPQDPDGPPYRPTGALWVSLRTGLLHLALPANFCMITASPFRPTSMHEEKPDAPFGRVAGAGRRSRHPLV